MNGEKPTPCLHGQCRLLCITCAADYMVDPAAWEDFGFHPAGLARIIQAMQDLNIWSQRYTTADPGMDKIGPLD